MSVLFWDSSYMNLTEVTISLFPHDTMPYSVSSLLAEPIQKFIGMVDNQ